MNLPALPITPNTGDTSSSVASLSNQGELPKDFIELLGKHLSLSSASSNSKTVVGAEADKDAMLTALGKDISVLNGDDLNALLSSFSSLSGSLSSSEKRLPHDAGSSDKAEKSASKEGEQVTDAATAAAMQALFAMLPTASGSAAITDDNITDKLQNAGLNLSEFLGTKRQGTTALSETDRADNEIQDALSQRSNASIFAESHSASGSSRFAKPTSSMDQSADDVTKFAATASIANNEQRNQEPIGASGNHLQSSPLSVTPNVQSTFTHSSATLAQPSGTPLNTPFGSQQWQEALGQQIVMFSRNGQQSAELRLNPQELGSLHISLKIDDNQAQIHLVSANSQVRSALEAALPHLRNAMAESGINLGQSSVGSDASTWQQAQQQMANNGNDSGSTSYQQQFGGTSEQAIDPIEVPNHLQSMASSVNGVDIFA
ncbi:flagellar hook-length control protein FliK [Pectobacterium sp. B1J-3]|uniref:flagellar hook-length control protein FliK n=1 Tax=Pectobacterium sp. B1J-3 TaxID=3385371 RepID=UPI003905DFAE